MGDGYCNDESNTFECNYDGGDCCGPCINTNLCTECLCFSNIPKYDIDCGNYFTDSCAKCTNFLCSEDCTRVNSECVPSFLSNPLVGNGVCNNETNTKECNFDGGDCCSEDCETIIVTLKDYAAENFGHLEGLYHKSHIINGRTSWTSTSTAIWNIGRYAKCIIHCSKLKKVLCEIVTPQFQHFPSKYSYMMSKLAK